MWYNTGMNIFLTIILFVILAETTILVAKPKNPLVRTAKRKIYVDSSALMDGRILEVAKTGFLDDEFIIPRSVLREMQTLADGKDSLKRERARFGLDVANELERVVHITTTILQDDLEHVKVDERLIELARENKGSAILTLDYNLNKVATTEGITVLNVNELAQSIRVQYLPGEIHTIKITTKGSNPKQGVGHLPDGTMVVVGNASDKIDQEITVELIRYRQTAAGRMVFAKLYPEETSEPPKQHKQYRSTNRPKPNTRTRRSR